MDRLPEDISALYKKWINKTASKEEEIALFELLQKQDEIDKLTMEMWQLWEDLQQENLRELDKKTLPNKKQKPKLIALRRWGWAAAVVFLFIGAYSLMNFNEKKNGQLAVPENLLSISASNDIQPGKVGAILTLSGGRQLVLDDLKDGAIVSQNGTMVRLQNEQLVYTQSEDFVLQETTNKLTTPKGRRFQVVLADGTKVWLNAASSISFPTVFNGNERKVVVTGEAFFEVAHNAQKPFKVITRNGEVEVLGTKFNINSYDDEVSVKTTLVDGSLRFKNMHSQVLLKPGQQGVVSNGDGTVVQLNKDVNISREIAWHQNIFDFDNATLPEVLKSLARWYDIEIIYQGKVPDIVFGGRMQRNLSLSQALKALEAMGVNFKLKNKILYVR